MATFIGFQGEATICTELQSKHELPSLIISSYAQAAGIFQFAGAQVATNVARMLVASSTGQSLDVDSLQMRVSMAMGVPPNGGFIRKIPMKMDDDWGYPYFWKPPNERLSTK